MISSSTGLLAQKETVHPTSSRGLLIEVNVITYERRHVIIISTLSLYCLMNMVYICTVTAVVSKPPHCLMRADAKTDMDIQQRKCPSALLSLFLAVNQENASDGNNLSLRVERIQQKEGKKILLFVYIFSAGSDYFRAYSRLACATADIIGLLLSTVGVRLICPPIDCCRCCFQSL